MAKRSTSAAANEMFSGDEKSNQWVGIREVAPYMILGGGVLSVALCGFLAVPLRSALGGGVAGIGVIAAYVAYFHGEEGVGYALFALFSIPAAWIGLMGASGLGSLESLAFFSGGILSVGFLSIIVTWWFRSKQNLEK